MYKIDAVSKMTGLTKRTLRYYDEIGLLKPHIDQNSGYRFYDTKDIDRLQKIMIYKKMGFELKNIKTFVKDNNNPIETLENQRAVLLQRKHALEETIMTIDKTILKEKGKLKMNNQEKFNGLKEKMIEENNQKYGKEVKQKYGSDALSKANDKLRALTEDAFKDVEGLGENILKDLKKALIENNPNSEIAQKVCQMHELWIKAFWPTYSKEAHLALCQMYLEDERFKAYYDKVGEGATQLLVDAMTIYLA